MSAKPRAAPPGDGTVFHPTPDGERWTAEGALTYANAPLAHAAAQALPLPTSGVIACAGLTAVDSAAVAVLLALKRRGSAEGEALALADPPAALTSLAMLYGVESILGG